MHTKLEHLMAQSLPQSPTHYWGRITKLSAQTITIDGLSALASIGDKIEMRGRDGKPVFGEVISLTKTEAIATAYGEVSSLTTGTKVIYHGQEDPRPDPAWIGKILNHSGRLQDGSLPEQGSVSTPLKASPPSTMRKGIGKRLNTGVAAIDTFLPLCQGQRTGLFAGSGVGKSSLLAELAKGTNADIVILALIGERGREVRDFTEHTLGPEGMKKSIVIVATSDEPPALKLRAAYLAMATAEYFRDQGQQVLLLFDSLTRFAESHRSVALSAGETPSLRAFPPSTFQALAGLCERAGPGVEGKGDITAVFSVLVAGSNMEEPVADMVRGILDGHVILERAIAERGRYPAIDIRRSVSRALPGCASEEENIKLKVARRLIGAYEDAKSLIQAGLYQAGSDPLLDEAVLKYDELDQFISLQAQGTAEHAFKLLTDILTGEDAESIIAEDVSKP
ncbi:MAG: flagellum-specific ATP synthase FliI [Robiginitomaculum sp.]|nr:MAG: flagellum-specific ATP synthase FliI [Robiginitomaculum sp.]